MTQRAMFGVVAGSVLALTLVALPQAQRATPAPASPRDGAAPGIGAVPAGPVDARVTTLKARLDDDVKSPAMFDLGQQMNDMVFSFGEIGFQEVETQRYLGKI